MLLSTQHVIGFLVYFDWNVAGYFTVDGFVKKCSEETWWMLLRTYTVVSVLCIIIKVMVWIHVSDFVPVHAH